MRNAIAHAVGPSNASSRLESAWRLPEANVPRATAQSRQVADQLRSHVSGLTALMGDAEADVLAFMGFSPRHRAKIHSNNRLERLKGEIKRHTDVVVYFQRGSRRQAGRCIAAWAKRQMGHAAPLKDRGDARTAGRHPSVSLRPPAT